MTQTESSYADAKARRYFMALVDRIGPLDRDRREAQAFMLDLAGECRRVIRKSGVILYAKRSRQGDSPYALYWGIFWSAYRFLKRKRVKHVAIAAHEIVPPPPGPPKDEPLWWRHVRGPLTPKHIFLYGQWKIRPFYLDFDRRRLALNTAYRLLTSALSRIRKILLTRYPLDEVLATWRLMPDFPDRTVPPAPRSLFPQRITIETADTLSAGWRLVFLTAACEEELIELSRRHNAAAPDHRLSLSFATDSHATYGRARWYLAHTGRHLDTLTQPTMRQLRIPQSTQRKLHDVEQLRRAITRNHRTLTRILARINSIAGGSLHNATLKRKEASSADVNLDNGSLGHRDGPDANAI